MMYRWEKSRKAALIGGIIAILLGLLFSLNVFQNVRFFFTDILYTPIPVSDKIVIVALDNKSLTEYGRSPNQWNRSVYADLLKVLTQEQARVVSFDLLYSETSAQDDIFMQALQDARQSNARLRIVLSAASVGQSLNNESLADSYIYYDQLLLPQSILRDASDYVGIVNIFSDIDGTMRRLPSRFKSQNKTYYSFALSTLLGYLRIPSTVASQLVKTEPSQVTITDHYHIPIDKHGVWLLSYFSSPTSKGNNQFKKISIVDVVQGNFPTDLFKDKIVLVGYFDALGLTDQYAVPSSFNGTLMSGVEIQANAIESLLQEHILQNATPATNRLIIMSLAVICSLLYAFLKWSWKLIIALVVAVIYGVIASIAFNYFMVVFDIFYPELAIVLPAIILIGVDITFERMRRERSDFLLDMLFVASRSRMSFDDVLSTVGQDVQSLLPDSSGSIYTVENRWGHSILLKEIVWGAAEEQSQHLLLATSVLKTRENAYHKRKLAFVVQWQGDIVCIITVLLHQTVSKQTINLTEDYLQRVSSSMDSAMLADLLQKQNLTLENILKGSPSLVCVLDDQENVILINDRFLQLMSDAQLKSQNLDTLIDLLDLDAKKRKDLIQKIHYQQEFREQVRINESNYMLDFTPIKQSARSVMILSDITSLIDLNRLRSQMLRMASHDLKNPLSRVKGYTELLMMRQSNDTKEYKFLSHVSAATKEMESLIADLLDIEKLRSSPLEFKRLDIVTLVNQIFLRHEPEAYMKGQSYQSALPDKVIMVRGDFNRLSQAISNLVGNSIKYTPEKGQIQVRVLELGQKVRFEVEDDGIGMSDEEQKKLFTEFYRVRNAETANIEGTGLGLSLVKSIIDGHEGILGVHSEKGQGSTFYFELEQVASDVEPDDIHGRTTSGAAY